MTSFKGASSIFWVISTSIHLYSEYKPMTPVDDLAYYEERKREYCRGITTILKMREEDEKVIIVENNGLDVSYLDDFKDEDKGVYIHYTKNQFLKDSCNKGRKEMLDIKSCMNQFQIQENDIIIKFTGRYILLNDSFPVYVRKNRNRYDAFFRRGSAWKAEELPEKRSSGDCVTGLIALRAKVFMTFDEHSIVEYGPIEWKIASHIQNQIPMERQAIIDTLYLKKHEEDCTL